MIDKFPNFLFHQSDLTITLSQQIFTVRIHSYTKYTDTEEGMSVNTESYYSFLGGGIGAGEDDDDSYASISSPRSFDPGERRRRISRSFLRMGEDRGMGNDGVERVIQ